MDTLQKLNEKIKRIRLLILDVDGVLTTGTLYYLNSEVEMKGFNIYDGLGIKLLQKTGITVAVISGKTSEPVVRRLAELNIQHSYLNYKNKIPAYEELKQKLQFNDEEIAYMGDDLPDLPVLKQVGFAITVPHAPEIIQQHANFITKNKGGKGAVREICELIMKTQGHYEAVIQSYIT